MGNISLNTCCYISTSKMLFHNIHKYKTIFISMQYQMKTCRTYRTVNKQISQLDLFRQVALPAFVAEPVTACRQRGALWYTVYVIVD